jgi:hypothetical protein
MNLRLNRTQEPPPWYRELIQKLMVAQFLKKLPPIAQTVFSAISTSKPSRQLPIHIPPPSEPEAACPSVGSSPCVQKYTITPPSELVPYSLTQFLRQQLFYSGPSRAFFGHIFICLQMHCLSKNTIMGFLRRRVSALLCHNQGLYSEGDMAQYTP